MLSAKSVCLACAIIIISVVPFGSAQRRYYAQRNNGTESGVSHNGQFERVHSQLSSLKETDEELVKRLEQIDLRLAQIEALELERWNAMDHEIKDVSRQAENLNQMTAKVDQNVQLLKEDIDNINLKLSSKEEPVLTARSGGGDTIDYAQRFDTLATILASVRNGIARLESNTNSVNGNITLLGDQLRMLQMMQMNVPTKQFLHRLLQSVRLQGLPQLGGNQFSMMDGVQRNNLPTTCLDAPLELSGILKIQTSPSAKPFYVRCEDEVDNGGWIIIQRRGDGSINFNRGWEDYKTGFGNLEGEFFIGLDKLHELTSSRLHELRIELEDFQGDIKHAKYSTFAIGEEKEGYALKVLGPYDGDAEDSLRYSAGYKFSTFDNDNDGWVEGNCAQSHTGAWWYNACEKSNLNGQYLSGEISTNRIFQGVYWEGFHGATYSLKSVQMMIRPTDHATVLQT